MRRTKAVVFAGTIALILALVLLMVVLTRSGSSGDSPAERAESLERALFAGDCAGVKKAVAGPEQVDCVVVSEGAASLNDVDVDSLRYQVIESAADSATVRVSIGDEEQDLSLVKVDGRWLVVLDSGA
jgi:hypothetical protein